MVRLRRPRLHGWLLVLVPLTACTRPVAPVSAVASVSAVALKFEPCAATGATCAGDVRQICNLQPDAGFEEFRLSCAPRACQGAGWCVNRVPCIPGSWACGGGYPSKKEWVETCNDAGTQWARRGDTCPGICFPERGCTMPENPY